MSSQAANIEDMVISAIDDGSWRDAYEILYPENEDDERESYFNSKESYEFYIDEVVSFFEQLPNEFYVYRSIHADSITHVDIEFPGEFWTINAETALNFGSHANGNFVMRGWIRKEDIDIKQSIAAYVEFSNLGDSDSEFEITIPDADVVVHDIEVFTNKEARQMAKDEKYVQPRIVSESIAYLKDVFLIEKKKRSSFEVLKDNKIALSEEERQECFDADAVWHPSNQKNPIPAVWKSKNSKGDIVYVTNTHRVYQTASTLKGAIRKFHEVVKGTA